MPNLRLTIDLGALAANWRVLGAASGAATGAAVKADGYGLGARAVVDALARAGCRDFFVASWDEAAALGAMPDGARLAVLHGVQGGEMAAALASPAVPVLCTPAQVTAWRAATTRPCDVMVDTGMNRLGLGMGDLDLLDGMAIDTVHSHLACADTPGHPANARQLAAFRDVVARVPARRASLANSSGVMLGTDYAFDLTRPGIGLYGGGVAGVSPVAGIEARVVQVRDVPEGATVGYGATWTAPRPSRIAVLNLGYADGYPRGGAPGMVIVDGMRCPVAGRVSMDLIAADVTGTRLVDGDWIAVDFDLATVAAAAGRSQYELLTGLGDRYARVYR